MARSLRSGRRSAATRERSQIIQDTLRRIPKTVRPTGSAGTGPPPSRLPSIVSPVIVGPKGADSLVPGPPGNPGAPGLPGAPGAPGAQGTAGIGVPGRDGRDGRESIIPGPAGSAGAPGAAGAVGAQGSEGRGAPGIDGRAGRDSYFPGPKGDQGVQGIIGLTGAQGNQGPPQIQREVIYREPLIMPPTTSNPGRLDVFTFCDAAIASQVINAATTAYLAGSAMKVGRGRLFVKHTFVWTIKLSKSAAGLNTSSAFLVKLGVAGTTADATILTFTLPATQTAVVDDAEVVIKVTIRGPLGAACVAQGYFSLIHNLAATGFATIPCVVLKATSAGFNSAVDALIAGIACTTAAATVLTFEQVVSEMLQPAA